MMTVTMASVELADLREEFTSMLATATKADLEIMLTELRELLSNSNDAFMRISDTALLRDALDYDFVFVLTTSYWRAYSSLTIACLRAHPKIYPPGPN